MPYRYPMIAEVIMPDALIEQDPYHWFNTHVGTLTSYLQAVEDLEEKGELLKNPVAIKTNLTHRKLLLEVYLAKLNEAIRILEAHQEAFKRAHPIYPPKATIRKDGGEPVSFDFYTWKLAVEDELAQVQKKIEA